MFHKIKNLFELMRINTVRFVLFILFPKKTRPIVLKYLEMKLNMITPQEFECWIVEDAQGI